MRMFALACLLTLFPAAAEAQAAAIPPHVGRPSFATSGREMMPQMMIDELALSRSRFDRIELPPTYWAEMKVCAARQGYDTRNVGAPPTILLVPAARTIRVHDLAVDSAMYAEDADFVGEHWSSPTIGYALTRSNVIVLTEEYRSNKYVLRHEALHFIVWRSKGELGHPEKAFVPCDVRYE